MMEVKLGTPAGYICLFIDLSICLHLNKTPSQSYVFSLALRKLLTQLTILQGII